MVVGEVRWGVEGFDDAVLKTFDNFHPVFLWKVKEGVHEGFSGRSHGG